MQKNGVDERVEGWEIEKGSANVMAKPADLTARLVVEIHDGAMRAVTTLHVEGAAATVAGKTPWVAAKGTAWSAAKGAGKEAGDDEGEYALQTGLR